MTGSVFDGEDIVQEALFQAYRKLDSFDDSRQLTPWIFRIAHNRCIDFLRRREVRMGAEAEAATPDSVAPVEAVGPALNRAVEHLVTALPAMERACVLLKDVFDYSLEEIAGLVDSSVGAVKSALNRGRSKLASLPARQESHRKKNDESSQLRQPAAGHKPTQAPPKGREQEFVTVGRSFLTLALHQTIHRSHVTDAQRAAGRMAVPARASN